MRNILKKILNKKFILSIILTVSFATLLKFFYLHVLHLGLSLDSLDISNLSFCTIVAFFKSVLYIILDELFPHTMPINSDVNNFNTKDKTAVFMEGKNSKPTSNSLSVSELEQLGNDMSNTLSKM